MQTVIKVNGVVVDTLSSPGPLGAAVINDYVANSLKVKEATKGNPFQIAFKPDGSVEVTSGTSVASSVPGKVVLSPTTLPGGKVGSPYNQTLTANGAAAPSAFLVTAGKLPAGLSLTPLGVLSGTPTADGPNFFTVSATDKNKLTGSQAYSIAISK